MLKLRENVHDNKIRCRLLKRSLQDESTVLWFIICNLVLYYSSLLDSNLCNFFSDSLGKCECISYFSKL